MPKSWTPCSTGVWCGIPTQPISPNCAGPTNGFFSANRVEEKRVETVTTRAILHRSSRKTGCGSVGTTERKRRIPFEGFVARMVIAKERAVELLTEEKTTREGTDKPTVGGLSPKRYIAV